MDTPTKLAAAAGISVPYASQIMSGRRIPTLALALSIFRKTGCKFGPLLGLPDEVIDQVEAAAAESEAQKSKAKDAQPRVAAA